MRYQWFRDDFALTGATNSLLGLTNVGAAQAGRYRVVVTNHVGVAVSEEAVVLVSVPTPAPPNDNFVGRHVLMGSNVVVSANNTGATKEAGEPNHAGNVGGRSVWWSWTAPSSGSFTISTVGSDFDTLLAVYTGTSLPNLVLLADNDDSQSRMRGSMVVLDAFIVTTYQIAVDGFSGDAGNVLLTIQPTHRPAFVQSPLLTNEGVLLHMRGDAGTYYVIQSSTNLIHWTNLATVFSENGPFAFLDTHVVEGKQRFYRAFREP